MLTVPEYTIHVETEPTVDEDAMLRVADRLHVQPGPLLGPAIALHNISEQRGRLAGTFQVEADNVDAAIAAGLAEFRQALADTDVAAELELVEANAGGPDDD